MNRNKLIGVGVGMLIFAVATFILFEFKTVKGGELGVMETWNDGVVDKVLAAKNYYLFPGFSKEIYTYDARLLTYELPEYTIRSSDNQDLIVTSKVQWRRDPAKLVQHHKVFKQSAEKVAINPAMISSILRHGTSYKAIDAYSGEGLVKMQKDIENDLLANKHLQDDGIIIESFIIISSHLKPEYLEMIQTRQLATLRQSAAVEKQKAAEAEALVAKSEAQANLNKVVVEAERDSQVRIIAAKAAQESQIVAAEGQSKQSSIEAEGVKLKTIAEAEGKMQAAISEAKGIEALGRAKAEAQRLQLEAFAAKGADAFTKVEIAKALAIAYSGIKGFIPEKMNVTVLTDNFNKAIAVGTGNTHSVDEK